MKTKSQIKTSIKQTAKELVNNLVEDICDEMNTDEFGNLYDDDVIFDMITLAVSIELMNKRKK